MPLQKHKIFPCFSRFLWELQHGCSLSHYWAVLKNRPWHDLWLQLLIVTSVSSRFTKSTPPPQAPNCLQLVPIDSLCQCGSETLGLYHLCTDYLYWMGASGAFLAQLLHLVSVLTVSLPNCLQNWLGIDKDYRCQQRHVRGHIATSVIAEPVAIVPVPPSRPVVAQKARS